MEITIHSTEDLNKDIRISAKFADELNHKYGFRKEKDGIVNHLFMEGDSWKEVKEYIQHYFPDVEFEDMP